MEYKEAFRVLEKQVIEAYNSIRDLVESLKKQVNTNDTPAKEEKDCPKENPAKRVNAPKLPVRITNRAFGGDLYKYPDGRVEKIIRKE